MRASSFRLSRAAAVVGVVLLLAACSEDKGAQTCGNIAPCGGELEGSWRITASCESIANFVGDADCPGATVDESMLETSGSIVFAADKSFLIDVSISGTRKFRAPLACVGAASCDEYASLISPRPPIATTTCTTAGSTCDCTMVYMMPETSGNGGTYSTAGNILSWAPTGGTPAETPYCVEREMLHLIDIDSTTSIVAIR